MSDTKTPNACACSNVDDLPDTTHHASDCQCDICRLALTRKFASQLDARSVGVTPKWERAIANFTRVVSQRKVG
jgi:hypothetical protein